MAAQATTAALLELRCLISAHDSVGITPPSGARPFEEVHSIGRHRRPDRDVGQVIRAAGRTLCDPRPRQSGRQGSGPLYTKDDLVTPGAQIGTHLQAGRGWPRPITSTGQLLRISTRYKNWRHGTQAGCSNRWSLNSGQRGLGGMMPCLSGCGDMLDRSEPLERGRALV